MTRKITRRSASRFAIACTLFCATLLCTTLLTSSLQAAPARTASFTVPVHLPDRLVFVVTEDGEELRGRIVRHSQNHRGFTRFTLEDEHGRRQKLRASEVDHIWAPADAFTHLEMVGESTTTIEKVFKTDYDGIFETREIIFETVTWPGTSKQVLVQLVNPGFERRVRVYHWEWAKEGKTSIGRWVVAGDEEKGYVVAKDGAAPFKVKKRAYRTAFAQLFGDCQAMTETYGKGRTKIKFKHFAEHVRAYDQLCAAG